MHGNTKAAQLKRAADERQKLLADMPKLYFVKDDYNNGYRLGRTDWPSDAFNIIPTKEFEAFRLLYSVQMGMPLLDKTDDEN